MNHKVQRQQPFVRILFVNGIASSNKGSMAIVRSAKEALEEYIPQAQFGALLDTSSNPSRYTAFGIETIQISSRKQAILIALGCVLWRILKGLFKRDLTGLRRKLPLLQYDLFIDVSGNCFRDSWGFRPLLFYLYPLFIGLILGKPLVFYGETMGPFTTMIGKFLAKFVLHRAKLVTVREEISRDILQQLGIKALLTAEPAFTLESSLNGEAERQISGFKGEGKLVGISLAQAPVFSSRWRSASEKDKVISSYVDVMAQVVDYLVEEMMVSIILVPHACGPRMADDRILQSRILGKIRAKDKVLSITQDYEPEELKGIIGECWIFIGTRMHANIAALSQGIPTIAIKCEHKAEGIMKQLDMEKYTVDIYAMTFDDMLWRIKDIWASREQISQELQTKMEVIRRQALSNAQLVKELLYNAEFVQ